MTPTPDVFDSPALPLLITLQDRGCHVELTPDTLIVEPASLLTREEQAAVRVHAEALAMLLRCCDPGVHARRDVMRQQFDSASAGRVPALLYRPDLPYVAGRCFSCGDPLRQFRVGRCWRCSLAWRLAARVPIPVALGAALDGARVVA
jgi:hypothetical protein